MASRKFRLLASWFVKDVVVRSAFTLPRKIGKHDDWFVAAKGDGWELGYDFEEGWRFEITTEQALQKIADKVRKTLEDDRYTGHPPDALASFVICSDGSNDTLATRVLTSNGFVPSARGWGFVLAS